MAGRLLAAVLLLLSLAPEAIGAPAGESNPLGWEWAVPPHPITGPAASSGGCVIANTIDRDGALVVFLAHPNDADRFGTEYRPVAFAGGRRFALCPAGGGGSNQVAAAMFRLDPDSLRGEEVTALGIESLSPEGRKVVSRDAVRRARDAGIDVLPFPEIGKPYEFALHAGDGRVIASANLKGKVVLLDGWATWCHPCMKKMPALKSLYEQRRRDGLEIVGLNFDHKEGKAARAIDSLGIGWPQVLVPVDDTVRDLWNAACCLYPLPHLIVLDREGILRADTSDPGEIEGVVTEALARGDRR